MLKKDFTYTNLDGEEETRTWYFNLSTAELAKMHLTADGDIVAHMQAVIDSKDGKAIIGAFEDIIRRSVGKRGSDGKSFVKSSDIADEFMGSEAYSEMFMQLVTDGAAAAEFISGIMPADLAEKAKALQAKPSDVSPQLADRRPLTVDNFSIAELEAMTREDLDLLDAGKMYDKPGTRTNIEQYSRQELLDMSDERFARLAGPDQKKWSKDTLVVAMMRRTRK